MAEIKSKIVEAITAAEIIRTQEFRGSLMNNTISELNFGTAANTAMGAATVHLFPMQLGSIIKEFTIFSNVAIPASTYTLGIYGFDILSNSFIKIKEDALIDEDSAKAVAANSYTTLGSKFWGKTLYQLLLATAADVTADATEKEGTPLIAFKPFIRNRDVMITLTTTATFGTAAADTTGNISISCSYVEGNTSEVPLRTTSVASPAR